MNSETIWSKFISIVLTLVRQYCSIKCVHFVCWQYWSCFQNLKD